MEKIYRTLYAYKQFYYIIVYDFDLLMVLKYSLLNYAPIVLGIMPFVPYPVKHIFKDHLFCHENIVIEDRCFLKRGLLYIVNEEFNAISQHRVVFPWKILSRQVLLYLIKRCVSTIN